MKIVFAASSPLSRHRALQPMANNCSKTLLPGGEPAKPKPYRQIDNGPQTEPQNPGDLSPEDRNLIESIHKVQEKIAELSEVIEPLSKLSNTYGKEVVQEGLPPGLLDEVNQAGMNARVLGSAGAAIFTGGIASGPYKLRETWRGVLKELKEEARVRGLEEHY